MSYFKADSQTAEDPEMMPSYSYHEPRERPDKPDDAVLWAKIREMFAAGDFIGLAKLYEDLAIASLSKRQAS